MTPVCAKSDHDPVSALEWVVLHELTPAAINNKIYRPVDSSDPEIVALAESIRRYGLKEPLVVTEDNVILSGHRRACACRLAKLTRVPVRREPITRYDPEFPELLVTYNQQRDKDPGEMIRERIVLADPEDGYAELLSDRTKRSRVKAAPIQLGERRKRNAISNAKWPFLMAVVKILRDLEDYWPLTDRRVHYALLNAPPLIHASKDHSRYANDRASYKAVIDLLTRGRLEGHIPWEAIGDETRPVVTWDLFPSLAPFVEGQIDSFLAGYWRDLTIGQPNHIEIVGEKMTVEGTIRPVAARFCVPYTIGRGYSSLPPRKEMFKRFKKSGKERLVILFMADHDPEGMDIPESFGKSMRDDFGIKKYQLDVVRVGLTTKQASGLMLSPSNLDGKKDGARYKKYVAKYGSVAWELEAIHPEVLRGWLRDAIASVIDVQRFNEQVEQEKRDAATLSAYREVAATLLKRTLLEGPQG